MLLFEVPFLQFAQLVGFDEVESVIADSVDFSLSAISHGKLEELVMKWILKQGVVLIDLGEPDRSEGVLVELARLLGLLVFLLAEERFLAIGMAETKRSACFGQVSGGGQHFGVVIIVD